MGLLSQTPSQYYNSSNSANYGDYQFVSLENIINAFMFIYVGENKIINKVSRTDVQFHAMRAIQELSYDVLRSFKSQEIEVPNTLSMILPQDYVNYIKLVRVGTDGIERPLYPARKTSDPFAITQNSDGVYQFDDKRVLTLTVPDSSQIADGDYLELFFQPADGSAITLSPAGSGNHKVYFIFDTDGDFDDFTEPSDEEVGPKFTVSLGSTALTSTQVATLLAQQINLFGKHTAVTSGNTITVTYNNTLVVDADSEAFASVTGSPFGSGILETFQSSGTDDGSTDSAYSLTITNSGTGSNTITEQIPSNTSENFQDVTPINYQLYDINYSSDIEISTEGRRYGLDPQHAQINGSFFIDQLRGLIKFGAALAGETVTLHYVSDGLGTDAETVVHKFCEEACYKHIAYGILSTRSNIPEYLVQRYKRERFAETRKAKIRLSNIKIEEFTQVLKGMGKQIK
tara:strand:+ start:835 stop:2208 length:1374 start_codon:yes stop_codon:yes gene_type:complete